MTVNNSPQFTQVPPNISYQTFVNEDGTTPKNLFVGGENGSLLYAINTTTNDTIGDTISLYSYNGSTTVKLDTVLIPAGSGTLAAANPSATPPVNLLSLVNYPSGKNDNSTNRFMTIGANETIQGGLSSAITSGKTLSIRAVGENF